MHARLTTDEVLALLSKRGLIAEDAAQDVRVREPAQRARVLRAQLGAPATRDTAGTVTAPEVIASFGLHTLDGTHVTEDLIMQVIAEASRLPWQRLDPLDLDAAVVTGTLSRPYARRHLCIAVGEDGPALRIAVAEPRDEELLENLRRITGREIHRVVASKSDILRIIGELYGFKSTIAAAEKEYGRDAGLSDLEQLFRLKTDAELEATDQHIVAAVDFMLRNAGDLRASDIHFEPKREEALVRFRIDGVLHTLHKLPRAIVPPLTSRMKMMARMDIAERRRPQDGRIKIAREGREIEMRVSTMPTVFGEKVVIRIFDPDVLLQDISALGFFEEQRDQWASFISRPHGIVLVTGPTGSGKTTTLYSTLKMLATPDVNVVSIEDPVEMVTEAFNQVAVNARVDVTFASALRTVLRQDPDIIMVGEIRDGETARYAVQAALTGHLVFSTLHTNDAASAFGRLIDLGVEPFLVASTVHGVAAQRLVRRICKQCGRPGFLTEEQVGLLGLTPPHGSTRLRVHEAEGCVECRATGYRGRSGVFEMVPVTTAIRDLITARASTESIAAVAVREGMMTLREAALKKLAMGVTTFAEVVRVTTGA